MSSLENPWELCALSPRPLTNTPVFDTSGSGGRAQRPRSKIVQLLPPPSRRGGRAEGEVGDRALLPPRSGRRKEGRPSNVRSVCLGERVGGGWCLIFSSLNGGRSILGFR